MNTIEFYQGEDAAEQGKSLADNPYDEEKQPIKFQDWTDGFNWFHIK